jgi:hypothetical protein
MLKDGGLKDAGRLNRHNRRGTDSGDPHQTAFPKNQGALKYQPAAAPETLRD